MFLFSMKFLTNSSTVMLIGSSIKLAGLIVKLPSVTVALVRLRFPRTSVELMVRFNPATPSVDKSMF